MYTQAEGQNQTICIFGFYFCKRCRNMMTPFNYKQTVLFFKCQSCGLRPVDYKDKKGNDCLLMRKQIKATAKKQTLDLNAIFDPSMQTVQIQCPQCGYGSAIYFLVPDQQETKMIARMMCKNASGMTIKCGNIWDLNDLNELTESKVIVKQLQDQSEYF